jgi:hypothetical protein
VRVRNLMLLVAMQKEAKPLIEKFIMKLLPNSLDRHFPVKAYESVTDKGRIILVVNGRI